MAKVNIITIQKPLSVAGFVLSKTGIEAPAKASFEEWKELGSWISQCEGAIHWWVGDWLNLGERDYGEKYMQALDVTAFDYQTLRNDKFVSASIELSRRRDNLSWSHHAEVAGFEPKEQDKLLDYAEKKQLSRQDFRKVLLEAKQKLAAKKAGDVEPEKYRCVVIDPPWPIEKIEREKRPKQGRDLAYPIMTLEMIEQVVGEKLKRAALADGCHVYLWVTQKFLPEGLRLLEAWGVQYQCVLTWVKPTGMTPYSWMYNTEHVLFGRLGSLNLQQMGIKLAFEAPITRHSAKPAIFYDRVRQASPGPRLSLFEREEREGFDSWGDEA